MNPSKRGGVAATEMQDEDAARPGGAPQGAKPAMPTPLAPEAAGPPGRTAPPDRAGPRDGASRDGSASLWRFLPLVLLGLGMAAIFATGAYRHLSLDSLLSHRERLQALVAGHQARALGVYVLVYVGAVALAVPGAVILTLLGGFLFGALLGGAAAILSASTGAIIVFLVAKTSVGDFLLRRAGPKLQGLSRGFQEDAFSYLLFMRLMPVFPFWITNLAPALFGVRLKTFALATLIGVVPGTFAFAIAGAGLDSVVAAQSAARDACVAAGGMDCGLDLGLRSILTPKLVIALAALGLLSLVPVVLKRLRAHPSALPRPGKA